MEHNKNKSRPAHRALPALFLHFHFVHSLLREPAPGRHGGEEPSEPVASASSAAAESAAL
jgi:hypothetical protein